MLGLRAGYGSSSAKSIAAGAGCSGRCASTLGEGCADAARARGAYSASDPGGTEAPKPQRARRLAWLTPAFGVAAVFFAALAAMIWMKDVRDNRRIHELEGQLAFAQSRSLEVARAAEETNKLLEMPGTVRVALMPMPGMPEGRAGVLYNAKMGMVACAGWLPAPPPEKSYQLWLVPMKGAPMPLRVLAGGEWTEPVMAHVTPGMEAKAFAVTEEPEGGMPWPTGPKVLAGAGE